MTAPSLPPPTTDREVALDAGFIALASGAICVGAHELALMTVLMPALVVGRMALWRRLRRPGRTPGVELALLGVCTVLGAFNDWSSVVGHGIYDYTVPVYFPGFSTIPVWMLLFWGMILRFLLDVATWDRLGPPAAPSDGVRLGPGRWRHNPWLKVALQLGLVFATRQTIYRFYLDPIASWLPFLLAAVLYAALFGLDRHGRRLVLVIAVGGPLIEVLYIQVAQLHTYHLGWLGGVPLWIALWWVVAMLVWADLGRRLHGRLLSWGTAWRAARRRRGGNVPSPPHPVSRVP